MDNFRALARATALGLLTAGLLGPAVGADLPDSTPASAENTDLAAARKAVQQKQWAQASVLLQRAVASEPRNADAHNLLGYSYRWQGHMDESFAHYAKALEIDPNHRGAHEYVGVAYLKAGKPALAEQHLAQLTRICGADCEETRDLAAQVADYKAGKR
jgi:Tfp pilus assembly protein PilF